MGSKLWRRSVVKLRGWPVGVGISQVKPSNRFRRLEKLALPSIFNTSLSSFMLWNLQSYPTTVLNERMWHFRGSNRSLTAPTYFQGVRTPQPPWSTPLAAREILRRVAKLQHTALRLCEVECVMLSFNLVCCCCPCCCCFTFRFAEKAGDTRVARWIIVCRAST